MKKFFIDVIGINKLRDWFYMNAGAKMLEVIVYIASVLFIIYLVYIAYVS